MERIPGIYQNKRDAARGTAWTCLGLACLGTSALVAVAIGVAAVRLFN